MKFPVLVLIFLSLQAHAAVTQDFLEVHMGDLKDQNLIQIRDIGAGLIDTHKLSTHQNSCGEAITFRGPQDNMNPKNLRIWIHGIGAELAAVNQDEDLKLNPVKLAYRDINEKITLLADRNRILVDKYGVSQLSYAIAREVQKDTKNYYVFFGDYLDGTTGWMTAVVIVKISSGEAVMFANSNDCF
jgi:hypothetical protein